MAQAGSHWPITTVDQVQMWTLHIGFVVDRVALGQVFDQVLWCSPVSIIPPLLNTHLPLQSYPNRINGQSLGSL